MRDRLVMIFNALNNVIRRRKMEFSDYTLDEFLTMGEGDPEKEKIEEEIYGKED